MKRSAFALTVGVLVVLSVAAGMFDAAAADQRTASTTVRVQLKE